MEMEKIALTKGQEVESIRLEPADNGGCVLRYTLHTPAAKNSESNWKDVTEVYEEEDFETKALPKILELYKANYYGKKANNAYEKGGMDMPMKAY